MGFKVQTAPAPSPSPSSPPEGGGNRTPELVGTLATAASLRGGGGGGLRFRGEPTYLVGAAAAVLVSGGGRGSQITRERRVAMEVGEGGR